MRALGRLLRALPLLILSPFLVGVPLAAIALADLCWLVRRRRRPPLDTPPVAQAASVIIPTWNGRELLASHLPSVVAALEGNGSNEIIVVDNGSDDASAEFIRDRFPGVRVLRLERNLGFGGGCNEGVRAAANDIVVLLNNDMRVEPGFLEPLLEGFADDKVFAVSCQIFFADRARPREETGLTQGWWENGTLRVRHRVDEAVRSAFPCFYGGGGSCAFDRRKFLELGGFDELLAPFYLEDTDLGYLAWKRGWKVLYEPRSVVHHEHRGTIGRRFPDHEIQTVLKTNFLLWTWKNIHEWPRLASHFFFAYSGAVLCVFFGDSGERTNLAGLWRAFRRTPAALRSRWRARTLAVVDDTEAFRRPLGGYFRDRFAPPRPAGRPLSVLFVSPYPICPPTHGGGVFMYQTARALARLCHLHLVALIDFPHEREAHDEFAALGASLEFVLRLEGRPRAFGSITPHAVREFANDDLAWLIHRQILVREVDVVQLEYMVMGQYAGAFRRLATVLFEHDIYFQSIQRSLATMRGVFGRVAAAFEYLRSLRWELRMLRRLDRVQVCSRENHAYLESFLPALGGRIDDHLRAGIDVTRYQFEVEGRQPETMLFLGSFRHLPNQDALYWFVHRVLPRVLEQRAGARLVIVGSDPPPRHSLPDLPAAIELRGYVEDVREPLARYALFVCPILAGSGVRVKLLEAFAAGIPAVSTRLGAEGLATVDGEFCALADTPAEFARKILHLFEHPEEAAAMARRARAEVEANRDIGVMTRRLVESYREALGQKAGRAV